MKNGIYKKTKSINTIVVLVFGLILTACNSAPKETDQPQNKKAKRFLTQTVINEPVKKQVILRGKATPVNKVTITSEVQGKALNHNKPLKEGVYFKKGETLLKIDNTDSKLNLLASKSKFIGSLNRVMSTIKLDYPNEYNIWEDYLQSYSEDKLLSALPNIENSNLRNYLITNGIYDMYYSIKSQENQLGKYSIFAPYNGIITASYVQPGEMVIPNKVIAEFNGTDSYEIEASVSLKDLLHVKIGKKVELTNRDLNTTYKGAVVRINNKLDAHTQMANVYISVKDNSLTEGMFLEGHVQHTMETVGFPVDRKLLKRNNELYVIRNSIVNLVPVQVLINQDNHIYVAGLKDNDMLISEIVNYPINGIKAISKN